MLFSCIFFNWLHGKKKYYVFPESANIMKSCRKKPGKSQFLKEHNIFFCLQIISQSIIIHVLENTTFHAWNLDANNFMKNILKQRPPCNFVWFKALVFEIGPGKCYLIAWIHIILSKDVQIWRVDFVLTQHNVIMTEFNKFFYIASANTWESAIIKNVIDLRNFYCSRQ